MWDVAICLIMGSSASLRQDTEFIKYCDITSRV